MYSIAFGGRIREDMRVIFLDFDGVLNSNMYNASHWSPGVLIDPYRMKLLKMLVDATDAEIVLSTSWKEHWSRDENCCDETGITINQIFKEHGLKILDKIPDTETGRATGIVKWLTDHPDVERFVVIDDMPLGSGRLKDHCVLTSRLRQGLDEDDVRHAIDILRE